MTTSIYMGLSYEDYKEVERQMKEFGETSHKTEPGFYHKSIRLRITQDVVFEFHGPLVKAGEMAAEATPIPVRVGEVEEPTALSPHIDPRTGEPYPSINKYVWERLALAEKGLYRWEMSSLRWIYQGKISND